MSLQKQLHDLKAQKKEQAKIVHRTYLRTKRDAKRAMSPDRLIRRHIGASLGVAAVAGLMLAPAPSRYAKAEAEAMKGSKRPRRSMSRKLAWVVALVRKFVPEAAGYLPEVEEETPGAAEETGAKHGEAEAPAPEKEKPKTLKSTLVPIALEMAMMLLQKIDWQQLLGQFMHKKQGGQEPQGDAAAETEEETNPDAGELHDTPPAATL